MNGEAEYRGEAKALLRVIVWEDSGAKVSDQAKTYSEGL